MIEVPEFLDRETCEWLVKFFEHAKVMQWAGEAFVARLYDNAEKNEEIKKLFQRMNVFGLDNFGEDYYIQNLEIAKRTDIGMGLHTDYEPHAFTMVCFLNDDFEGGEAIVDGSFIKPEVGKAIVFRGNRVEHGVSLTEGTRYALLCWWTKL